MLAGVLIWSCSNAGNDSNTNTATAAEHPVDLQAAVADDVSEANILAVALGSADHTTLVAAVKAADMAGVLANNGPFTVFAPTNAAFAKLPEGTVDNLLLPENKAQLARIIKFHAAPGTYTMDRLKDGMQLYQANGQYISVRRDGDDIYVNDSKLLAMVEATNGLVYVVDDVFLPAAE